MATRAYRRNSKGQFAGSGGGSMITYGKAGGFANAAFRARTSSSNQKASPRKTFALGQRQRKALRTIAKSGAAAAGTGLALAALGRVSNSGSLDRAAAMAKASRGPLSQAARIAAPKKVRRVF